MNKKKYSIPIIAIMMTLSACTGNTVYGIPSPTPMFMRNMPQGDDSFSKGFRDGCYHFMGQSGFGLIRIYDAAPDPELFADRLYRQGYTNGDRTCGSYVNKKIIL